MQFVRSRSLSFAPTQTYRIAFDVLSLSSAPYAATWIIRTEWIIILYSTVCRGNRVVGAFAPSKCLRIAASRAICDCWPLKRELFRFNVHSFLVVCRYEVNRFSLHSRIFFFLFLLWKITMPCDMRCIGMCLSYCTAPAQKKKLRSFSIRFLFSCGHTLRRVFMANDNGGAGGWCVIYWIMGTVSSRCHFPISHTHRLTSHTTIKRIRTNPFPWSAHHTLYAGPMDCHQSFMQTALLK